MPAFDRARSLAIAEKFVKAGKMAEASPNTRSSPDDNPRDMNVVNKLGDLLVRRQGPRCPEAIPAHRRLLRPGWLLLKAIAMYKRSARSIRKTSECQRSWPSCISSRA